MVVNRCRRLGRPALAFAWLPLLALGATARAEDALDFSTLSIEDLANIEITSASRRAEPLLQVPAAIYVITSEDIRRSGGASLPEALRLAPNLQVAQRDALSHAISARGFNSYEASNKLLVMVDGRSVYSLLHSGVFWDAQDLMLEDIDRVEVVRGPGGAVWGANAVNGVINVITRHTRDTQGALVSAGGGNVDRHVSGRYGGAFSDDATYRVYVKGFERGHTLTGAGAARADDWDRLQGGFAFDLSGGNDTLNVQGNIYDSSIDAVASEISGRDLSARWVHTFADGSPLDIQVYYDRTRRIAGALNEGADTYNIDAQHTATLGGRHTVVWGGGYRVIDDFFSSGTQFVLVNPKDTFEIASFFVQDEFALLANLRLTVGLKLEHHTYTGLEYMPSARLAWNITPRQTVWAAAARAVRTPSRLDRELTAPGIVSPAPNFESETLVAYEAGYRVQASENAVLSMAVFYNVYDELRIAAPAPPGSGYTAIFRNGIDGHSYGVEGWANYRVTDWWRLGAGFNVLRKDFRLKPGLTDISARQSLGNDPRHQASLRSYMTLLEDVELDLTMRAVDNLPNPAVPSYVAFDARLGWFVTDTLELSVAGTNLLDPQHPETGTPAQRGEIRRAVYAGARWRF
ncbi:MAG: TonB-dependent receptor plug domain-containing protein [Rhodospirillaceae bacterium]